MVGWNGRRAGVRGQETRGEQIRQLLPEQGIQCRTAFNHVRRAHEQSGRSEVGMSRSFEQIAGSGHVGFAGNALERCGRKIELNDIDGAGNIPSGAGAGGNDRHNPSTRRSDRD
jgi:hypothetical protein